MTLGPDMPLITVFALLHLEWHCTKPEIHAWQTQGPHSSSAFCGLCGALVEQSWLPAGGDGLPQSEYLLLFYILAASKFIRKGTVIVHTHGDCYGADPLGAVSWYPTLS